MRRFISEDPIRLKAGINFYAYVGNNPLNRFDPYGEAVGFKIPAKFIDCLRKKFNIGTQVQLYEIAFGTEDIMLGVALEALGFTAAGPLGAVGVAPGAVALIGGGGFEIYISGSELIKTIKDCWCQSRK